MPELSTSKGFSNLKIVYGPVFGLKLFPGDLMDVMLFLLKLFLDVLVNVNLHLFRWLTVCLLLRIILLLSLGSLVGKGLLLLLILNCLV